MLKNNVLILAGAMALVGAVGGTALMASAQSATTTSAPVTVTGSTTSENSAVDTPESANDPADTESAIETPDSGSGKADTDNVQAGPGSTIEQTGEHQDESGGAQSEANEPAGSTDTLEQ